MRVKVYLNGGGSVDEPAATNVRRELGGLVYEVAGVTTRYEGADVLCFRYGQADGTLSTRHQIFSEGPYNIRSPQDGSLEHLALDRR